MKRIVLSLSIILLVILSFIWLYNSISKTEKVTLEIIRFEKELFSVSEENVIEKTKLWNEVFGAFPEIFATKIMQRGTVNDAQYYNELLEFTHHKDMREAYDSTVLMYNDLTDIEDGLESAFEQFSFEFPSYSLPEIITFFGGFNYGVVTYDTTIAVGLENFLGAKSKYYRLLRDPEYLRFQKQRKFILSNVMEAWFNELFEEYQYGRDLLSQLIYKGKVMYFIDNMLVDIPLEDKFRFTSNQMNWVIQNESSIWQYLVYEDLLFSNKESDFRTFVNYAPFAKGMPKEAPGRVGYFIGYRMVNEYMKNNEISIEEMIYLTDSRLFMQQSKYKPKE